MHRKGKFYEFNKQPGTYIIEEKDSGKFYIGSSVNLNSRLKVHCNDLKANKHHVKELQKLYDEGKVFDYKFFPTETRDEAYTLEQRLLDENKESTLLLNKAKDARSSGKGMVHTDEFKQMISSIHKGKIVSEETKEKMRQRVASEETRKKIGLINLGKTLSDEQKNKMIINNPKSQKVTIDGKTYPSLRQAGIALGVSHKAISKIIEINNVK